jgi:isocitrate dehydrogenase (NAD+)
VSRPGGWTSRALAEHQSLTPLRIVVIDGDGIGPEIVKAAQTVLEATGLTIQWQRRAAGLTAYRETGVVVTGETLTAIEEAGAALKGPFLTPSGGSTRSANWYIRRQLGLFAGLRPIQCRSQGIDLLIVRENVEDLYGAVEWQATPDVAHAVKIASRDGCRRIATFAFATALREGRRRVTVVHKANNLKLTDGMFLEVAREVSHDHPDVELNDMLVDTAAYTLVRDPHQFDVLLAPNTFGDILSSVGAALEGSLGLLPSLNVGVKAVVAEAAHGAAPDLTGTNRANPVAMIRAAGMLLQALGRRREGAAIREAVEDVYAARVSTPDAGGTATTTEVAARVANRVQELLEEVSR